MTCSTSSKSINPKIKNDISHLAHSVTDFLKKSGNIHKTLEIESILYNMVYEHRTIDSQFYERIREKYVQNIPNYEDFYNEDLEKIKKNLPEKKFAFCDPGFHASLLILHPFDNGRIWSLETPLNFSDAANDGLYSIETDFHNKKLQFQADANSCRVIAIKTLNRLHKKDNLFNKTHLELSYSDENSKKCYPHPMVFSWSQSNEFINAYTEKYIEMMPNSFFDEKFKSENKKIVSKDDLKKKIKDDIHEYRSKKNGQSRLLYYALKLCYKENTPNQYRQTIDKLQEIVGTLGQ